MSQQTQTTPLESLEQNHAEETTESTGNEETCKRTVTVDQTTESTKKENTVTKNKSKICLKLDFQDAIV